LGGVSAEKLYLKLDNKLQMRIQSLHITPSSDDESIDWFYVIEAVELFPLFFERVDIDSINASINEKIYDATLSYKNNTFHIDSDIFYLYSQITKEERSLVANPLIHLKKQDLFLFSTATFNPFSFSASAQVEFMWHDAKGVLSFEREGKTVTIGASSEDFQNLKDIFDNFGLHKEINAWTYDYIRASDYRLEYMQFTQRLDEPLDLYNLKAKATAKDVTVTFHPKVAPVHCSGVDLFFDKGKLLFDLKNPVYEGKDLNGSLVYIDDLLDEKDDFIVVDIKTKAPYDNSIESILHAYGIDILIKQTKGVVDANVILNILFKNGHTVANGSFEATNAEFDFLGYTLPAKKASVKLNDSLIRFETIEINDATQHFFATGELDTAKKSAKIDVAVKRYDKYYLDINDTSVTAFIDFTDDVVVNVPKLYTTVTIGDDFHAKTSHLHKLIHYVPSLDFDVFGGSVEVYSDDFNLFHANIDVLLKQNYLMQDSRYLQKLNFNVLFDKNTTQTQINYKDKIRYDKDAATLLIEDYALDLSPAIDSQLLEKSDDFTLRIGAKNSPLIIHDRSLVVQNYTLDIDNDNVTLQGSDDEAKVLFTYQDGIIDFEATKLQDKTLHPLLNFAGVTNGSYDVKISGTKESLNGYVSITGGTLTNMKAYNNLIALVNTIPALAIFKSPGFNEDGLSINGGKVEFVGYGDYIYITKLFINGKSSDVEGSGVIDLKNETLDIDLKIKTIRELGSLVSNIPLAGYIIFGDDKSLSFGAKVTGSLQDPQVQTQTMSDIVKSPYNLLKRTIESPFKLFESIFSTKDSEK
jgi:hypothetical protein